MAVQGPARGSVVPKLLRPLAQIRAVVGQLGLHQVPVTLKSWLWTSAGGAHRVGTGVTVPLPDLQIGHVSASAPGVVQPPHVVGTSGDPAVTIDYLTPAFFAEDGVTQLGGYRVDQLNLLDQPGLEHIFVLAWPQGPRNYVLAPRGLNTSKSMHYTLQLISTDQVVPF